MYCVWSDLNSSDCFLTAKTCLKIAADGKDGFFFDRKASYVKSDPMPNSLYVMQDFSQEVFWKKNLHGFFLLLLLNTWIINLHASDVSFDIRKICCTREPKQSWATSM